MLFRPSQLQFAVSSKNVRNGSNMALINAEVRIPIWSTLSSQSVESDLLEHLQWVGFADVGSAWNGKHPL